MTKIDENKLERKIALKSGQEELLDNDKIVKQIDLENLKPEQVASKKVAEDDDDDDDDDFGDEEEKDIFSVTYSTGEEQFLAENFYSSNSRNIFTYTFKGNTAPAEIYEDEIPIMNSKNNSETMDNAEAKEMLVSVQYAKVLGTMTEINSDERKKFANWVMFNPALWKLFHRNYSVTEDVDYSKTV